jgi:hypothetical protein
MFSLSVAMMLFVVDLAEFRMAAIGLGVVTFAAWWRRVNDRSGATEPTQRRWIGELALLLVAPALLLLLYDVCQLLCWGCESQGSGPVRFGSQIPHCDGLSPAAACVPYVQMAVAAWLVWRHRARLWGTATIAGLALWWAIGAWTALEMAISGNWL